MTTFQCPRCGGTEQAIATMMVHECPMPHRTGDGTRGRRVMCDGREVGVYMDMVAA